MKVRDLIAELQKHDPDETVFAYREDRVGMGAVKLDRMTVLHYDQRGDIVSQTEPMLVMYGLYVEDMPSRDIYDSAGLILRRGEKPRAG